MEQVEGPSGLVATAVCLGFTVASTWIMQMLPPEVSTALVAWMLTSVPISIVIGHCALSGD